MNRPSTQQVAPHDSTQILFGFWVYILTDCILFASLFSTYAVLHVNTFCGASARDLFSANFALVETLILLTSSFTCALAGLSIHKKSLKPALCWYGLTFLLGVSFLYMELTEFAHLVKEGHTWEKSAFLSSFFTLVATHGLHITAGLIWILVMIAQVLTRGFTATHLRRLKCLNLFWHFLDIVWIFIFTVVYLMGVA